MRIALNAGNLRGFGSSSVGMATIRSLQSVGGEHVFGAWVPASWPAGFTEKAFVRRVRPGALAKLTTENVPLRAWLRSWRADCLFSLGDTSTPRCAVPHLLLVQQAHLAYEPEDWGYRPSRRARAKFGVMAAYFGLGTASVQRFTVQTEAMRTHLTSRWGIDPARIVVVPSTVDDYIVAASERPLGTRKRDTICYVASAGEHKNHRILAGAMAYVARRHPELRCVVTVHREHVSRLVAEAERRSVLDRFVFTGPISRAAAVELMATSALTVIPSKLESFGVPYYEALALGLPVVAAHRDFAREACGDAALYADDESEEDFGRAITRILDEPASWSERARKRFTEVYVPWSEIGRRYLAILETIA